MIKSDKHDYSEPLCDNAQLTARDNVCYLDMSAFQDRLDLILTGTLYISRNQPKGAFDRLCTPEGGYKVRSFQISSSVKIWGLNSKTTLYTLQYCLRRFYKCCCTLSMPG